MAIQIVHQELPRIDQPSGLIARVAYGGSAFVATVLGGGVLIAVGPGYVDHIVECVDEDPLATIGWDILVFVAVSVVLLAVLYLLSLLIVLAVFVFPFEFLMLYPVRYPVLLVGGGVHYVVSGAVPPSATLRSSTGSSRAGERRSSWEPPSPACSRSCP